MHLVGVLGRNLAQAIRRWVVEHPVGLAILDLSHLGLSRETELLDDHVGVAVRLRVLRPLLEVRVADELDLFVRVVLDELVRPRPRRRDLNFLVRRAGREDERKRNRELVEELRVALRQVERDRSLRVVDDDSLVEIASLRALDAGVTADDDVVPGAGVRARADLEEPLEGVLDVARLQFLAVRELDALAKRERVRLAAVRRLRHGRREIGDELRPFGSTRALETDETVVGDDQELPLLQGVVDLRVG